MKRAGSREGIEGEGRKGRERGTERIEARMRKTRRENRSRENGEHKTWDLMEAKDHQSQVLCSPFSLLLSSLLLEEIEQGRFFNNKHTL